MALIYLKNGTEKTLILAVRELLLQRFQATNWTDLRVGFFLSVTAAVGDDTITGLGEVIGTPPRPILTFDDVFRVGLTDSVSASIFLGYANTSNIIRGRSIGTSELDTSDEGLGTTNTNFWRPATTAGNNAALLFLDGGSLRAKSVDGSQ